MIGFDFDFEVWEKDLFYVSLSGIYYVVIDEFLLGYLFYMDGRVCWGLMFGINDVLLYLFFDYVFVIDYKYG